MSEDFMFAPRARCHIYRLPSNLTSGYCFDGGHPISFQNVDWFDAPISEGRDTLIRFIKKKRYFDPTARFLVLADHPDLTFTIEPATGAGAGGMTDHILFETGDPDAPDVIRDRNGEVVLGLCRRCGRAEIELSEPCQTPAERVA